MASRAPGAMRTRASYDLKIPLQLPVGDRIEPLPPLPFPSRREVIDEVVAEPVARQLRAAEDACGFDQGARRAGNVLRTFVSPVNGLGGELQLLFDARQAGSEHRGGGEIRIHIGAGAA